jgi:hypothetical protein
MTHQLTNEIFEMVLDAMNAIRITHTEEFVKQFDSDGTGFMCSNRPEIRNINDAIQYNGHSGSSFGYTMQYCSYYLNNPDEWMNEVDLHSHIPVLTQENKNTEK